MARFLLFLLGALTGYRPGQRDAAWRGAGDPVSWPHWNALQAAAGGPAGTAWPPAAGPLPPADTLPGSGVPPAGAVPDAALPPADALAGGQLPPGVPAAGYPGPVGHPGHGPGHRRRRVPGWAKMAAAVTVLLLIFRRAVASVVLMALSAGLHLVGINVHLPSVRFGWPWQTIGASTTTNTDLGPWVLQKVEGISRPAFGQANFSFLFTHKVSRNIGFWPCWYASTFYAVAHASATVDLNPGRAWWAPATGHYRLQVLSRPGAGKPGRVAVAMVLPLPQLPQSVHDITIDNVPSKPVDTQHSFTYPGLGCGVLLRPQFPESVLYSQAQSIAFYRSTHAGQVTGPLIRAAENQATQTIRDDFIQPTVNALGYTLDRFTMSWAAPPPGR